MARFDLAAAATYVNVGATDTEYRELASAVSRFVNMGEIPAIAALAQRYPDASIAALFSAEEMTRLRDLYGAIGRLYAQSQALYFAGNLEAAWQVMREAAKAAFGVYDGLARRAPDLAAGLREGLGNATVEAVSVVSRAARGAAEAATGAPGFLGKLLLGVGVLGLGYGLYKATEGKR